VQAQADGVALVYTGATIHVGNGKVIANGTLICQGGKITYVGEGIAAAGKNGIVKNVQGKHLYPGLIALNNIAGLSEIDQAKPTHDFAETGFLNPHIRSAPAYNCDSKILPTLTYNGILFTQPTPQGAGVTGTSSLMSTGCRNWPDAAVKTDAAMHLHWPEFAPNPGMSAERIREAREKNHRQVMQLKTFFSEAAAYCKLPAGKRELKFEACRAMFTGKQKVFIHAAQPDVFADAALFFQSLQVQVIWATGNRAAELIPFLREHHIAVVVNEVHRLPATAQSAVNEPYELPALLAREGITFAIAYSGSWAVRSLPYSVGTAITHGLDKEIALASVTGYAAQLAGVEDRIGTLEEGKSASLVLSVGDLFDMQSGKVEEVLLNGMPVDLTTNKQLELYQKYNKK
jgi:imidazolonepropionase-like amidohydrolase